MEGDPLNRIESVRQRRVKHIACVRNPWDRIHAVWKFSRQVGRIPEDTKFADFVSRMPYKRPVATGNQISDANNYFVYRHTTPTLFDAYILDGVVEVDYLLYFENLGSALDSLQRKLGFSGGEMPWINRSTDRRCYFDDYDPVLVKKVRGLYWNEIQLFGYQFAKPIERSLVQFFELNADFQDLQRKRAFRPMGPRPQAP